MTIGYNYVSLAPYTVPQGSAEDAGDKEPRHARYMAEDIHHEQWKQLKERTCTNIVILSVTLLASE